MQAGQVRFMDGSWATPSLFNNRRSTTDALKRGLLSFM